MRHTHSFIILGRGVHYAIAREGALKLKESAYIQAEGYPTGEFKHGPNALVDDQTTLIVLATCNPTGSDAVLRYEKNVNLLRDLQRQRPNIVSIVSAGDTRVAELSDHSIVVPPTSEYVSPIDEAVPLQMLAYFLATDRNIDVDAPETSRKPSSTNSPQNILA